MNLRSLRYFVAIVDAGSLTAAADAISIAQPALSRRIHDLERDLGAQLLQRTPRGVRMTQAGATLYESAIRMLAEAQAVRKRINAPQGGGADGSVTLGASPTLAGVLVPGVFERWQRSLGGVKLIVREAFTPMLVEWLEKGKIDVALITSTPSGSGRRIATQSLLGEPFVLVTQTSHPARPIVPVSQLTHIPLLMTTLHRSIVEQGLAPLGIRLNVHSEIDSVDAIRELVLRGLGSTLMPVSVFKQPRAEGRVMLSEISGVQLNRQLLMATRIERRESAALAVLKELVQAEVSRLTARGIFSLSALRSRST